MDTGWSRRILVPPPKAGVVKIWGETRRLRAATLTQALNVMPEGTIDLDQEAAPIDYAAELQVGWEFGGSFEPRFTGHVVRAYPHEGLLRLEVKGGRILAEAELPFIRTSGVPFPEILSAVLEELGGKLEVKGTSGSEPPLDVFCIQVPVDGIEPDHPVRIGRVWLSSAGPENVDASKEIEAALGMKVSCIATSFSTARRLDEAQRRGIREIDAALDLLTATTLYSYSETPDGALYDYSRDQTLTRARRLPAVLVRGLLSRKGWVRETTQRVHGDSRSLAGFQERWPAALDAQPSGRLLWAMGALRRAADVLEDPVQRNQALWASLEFYASRTVTRRLISAADLSRARHALGNLGLEREQEARLKELVGKANEPPLMAKIVAQARADGAGLSSEERELLKRLRNHRNGTQHGQAGAIVGPDDLARGVALVSRLLVFRWHGEGASGP